MSAELPWRYRLVPACWEWRRFDASWMGGGIRGLRALVSWQSGRCGVCGGGFDAEPTIDSEPSTRLVRGLLCPTCAGGESRSHARVFRCYRRLHPATLIGVTVASQVVDTAFWQRWQDTLARGTLAQGASPRASGADDGQRAAEGDRRDAPSVRRWGLRTLGRRTARPSARLVVDLDRPERFRTRLERDAPDVEQAHRMWLGLQHALEDLETYVSPSDTRANPHTDP